MIYDCFTFFNELDLLEIRLHELNDVVDFFVISEATKTFTGMSKPLVFEENKQKFAKFLHKIKHIIVNPPETDNPWVRERFQRDQMFEVLSGCDKNDVIMLSDVDEIISAKAVRQYNPRMGIRVLEMKMFYYFFNCKFQYPWPKAKIFPFWEICKERGFPLSEFRVERDEENHGAIYDAGWHFSFLGDVECISLKIDSFSEQQYNKKIYNNKDNIQNSMENGKDVFGRAMNFEFVEIDNSYPKFITENLDRFKRYISTGKKTYFKSKEIKMISDNPLMDEIVSQRFYQPVQKDILIVVKDQLEFIKPCIESIIKCTTDFNLFIWDNGSQKPTADYLQSVKAVYHREEKNLGFIIPNNRLAAMGTSPYVILLNSDTIVRNGWDRAMIGWLQSHPSVGLVGYEGARLDNASQGYDEKLQTPYIIRQLAWGYSADYIAAWCMAFPRSVFNSIGLFDEEHLSFAYGEDSDFSLRIRSSGLELYVLHMLLVEHFKNKTIKSLVAEGLDLSESFKNNHLYFREKWGV